jgi:glycosyltransferase involved in cell wall biosynthesis
MLREKLSVYYITDDFTQFKGHPSAAIEKAEKKLIGKCDLIIASARSLAEKKQQPGKPVSVVSHGVNHAHFAEAMTLLHKDLPADIRDLPRPILGFYGELNSWIDLPMIARAAQKRPAWSFALIGRVAVEAGNIEYLKKIPNIHLLGQKQYGELPAYCAAFNAALIPMVVNELTQHVNPLKLREYLAAGVPVISTPLPEVKPYADVVSFAVTADELIAAFEAVRRTPEKGRSARLSKRVEPEGWDGKVEEISALIGKAIGAA